MLKPAERIAMRKHITEAIFCLAQSGNTRNSYARRRRLRHRLYKAVGEMNKIVREMDRTGKRADSRNDLRPSFPRETNFVDIFGHTSD